MASAAVLRQLLEPTSLPEDLVEEFLAETNALWLLGERDDVVAGEIVLCHPPLEAGEVRAVVKGTDQTGAWRITVVTTDRPGLLTATAAVLANEGLAVTGAAVTVLESSRVALQRVTVGGPATATDDDWERLGDRLRRGLIGDGTADVSWEPSDPVAIESHPQGYGRTMIQIEAPDRIGLLWAIAGHLHAQGVNVEGARLGSEDGTAKDVFIVVGDVDTDRLLAALSVSPARDASPTTLGNVLTAPLRAVAGGLRLGAHLLARRRRRRAPP
ncbi:MAG: ACT domain-containing protein [Actinomycetota bacterium]|nr:ACT domain-containing protein [Actinomycetota bacterium]